MRSTQIPALGDGMKLAARAAAAALLTVLALAGMPATSAEPSPATARANSEWRLRGLLRAELEAYLKNRRIPEHISAVSLRATLPGGRYIDVSVGSTRFDGGRPVSAKTLWQIGSNTKAFLSVILLQLEAEGKLSIEDTLDKWLPQYPAWGRITIRQLLNMTSGIPEYLDVPAFRVAYAATPEAIFSATDLVSFAVGLPLDTAGTIRTLTISSPRSLSKTQARGHLQNSCKSGSSRLSGCRTPFTVPRAAGEP